MSDARTPGRSAHAVSDVGNRRRDALLDSFRNSDPASVLFGNLADCKSLNYESNWLIGFAKTYRQGDKEGRLIGGESLPY
jgi:hypothetical protein